MKITTTIILCIILFFSLFVGYMIYENISYNKQDNWCKGQGWEGVIYDFGSRCYKNIPHESGIGTIKVYSGYF